VTVHNGYDEHDVAGFRGRKLAADHILLTSIGSLYGGRDPGSFLEAVKELYDEGYCTQGALRILMINASDWKLEMMIEKLHLQEAVRVLPWMPQSEAFEYLAQSHVALLVGSDMEKVAMTTKVYEYAGMGKIIFALVPDGPVKDFVEKCSGVTAAPNDKDQIKTSLKALVRTFQKGQTAMLDIASVAARYERSALTLQMAELLHEAALNSKREKNLQH
jgi:glycosyltransferase involved in cell wall biosynthesis